MHLCGLELRYRGVYVAGHMPKQTRSRITRRVADRRATAAADV